MIHCGFAINKFMGFRSEAESISLQQDASKGWLVMQFGSSTSQLQERHGYVGALHMPAELQHVHAPAIRKASELVLQELAMPGLKMPFSDEPREEFPGFLAKLYPRVEALTADGASDEQLALNMLQASSFPNLKATSRDLPHSMRRVASRTSFADPFLKKTCFDMICFL